MSNGGTTIARTERPTPDGLRVLIVDDEHTQRILLKEVLLSAFGHDRIRVDTTPSAASIHLNTPSLYDVILLDLELVETSGRQTFESVHARAPMTPIIVVTGRTEEELARSLLGSGAQDYLIKGQFDARGLAQAIRYSIERQRLVRELANLRDDLAVAELAVEEIATGMPTAVYTWRRVDNDFVLESLNGPAAGLFLDGVAAVPGMHASQLPETIRGWIEHVFRSGESVVFAAKTADAFGRSTDAAITCAFVPPANVIVFVAGADQQTATAARQAAATRFRTFFSTIPVPALLWRLVGDDFEYIDRNPAAAHQHGGIVPAFAGARASTVWGPSLVEAMRRASHTSLPESVVLVPERAGMTDRDAIATVVFVRPDKLLVYIQSAAAREHRAFTTRDSGYHRLLDHAPVGVALLDTNERILHVNTAMATMLRYSPEQLRAMSLSDLLFPADKINDPFRIDLLLAHGSLRRDRLLRAGDGQSVLVDISAVAVDGGQILATARDLSELRRSEEQVAFQTNLLAHVQNAVVATDSDGRVIYWNHMAERLYGWSSQEAVGQPIALLNVPPEQADAIARIMQDVAATGHWEGDFISMRKDGQRVPVFVALSSTRDAVGRPTGYVGVSFDLTDLRRAEEERARSEALFRSLVEHSSDVISILSAEGVVLYQSPSIRNVLGYEPDTLLGREIFDYIRPEQIEDARKHLKAQVTIGVARQVLVDFRHANGEWRSFDVVTTRVVVDGEAQIIANARDVTERNEIARAKRMTDLGRIAATIAHEINNILMGIQPFADIIHRKAGGSPELTAAAQHISRAVLRGRRVTHEILRFARPAEPQLTVLDCHELLVAATRELRHVLPDSIDFVVHPITGCGIRADRDQLTQVLTNLVLNARDAMPDGGVVKLQAEHIDSRMVEISVSDTGGGMPPDVLAQIFDPLFTTKPRGTGLGLSIVHQIIAAHGGTISAESSVGRGSTFRIRLPIALMGARRPEPEKTEGGRLQVKRILLADDEAEVAAGLSILLEQEGCEVSTVHYGRDVEPEIERFRPDVLVLDFRFPDITGDVIYERVARRWPDLPTVFSTGETDIGDLERFLGRPHIAYVRKPYEFSDLLGALRVIVTPPALRSSGSD